MSVRRGLRVWSGLASSFSVKPFRLFGRAFGISSQPPVRRFSAPSAPRRSRALSSALPDRSSRWLEAARRRLAPCPSASFWTGVRSPVTRIAAAAIADAVFLKAVLELSGFLRLRQLRFQVVAQVLLVVPWRVAEGAFGAVDEIKPLLNERTSLQGGKERRVSLQAREVGNDRRGFCLCQRPGIPLLPR